MTARNPTLRRAAPGPDHALITTLTAARLDELVAAAHRCVVVEFMTYGCAHCRVLEPVLQRVARAVADTTTVFRVNVAVEAGLTARFGISGTPTLVMFLDGTEVGRVEGPSPTFESLQAEMTAPFGGRP